MSTIASLMVKLGIDASQYQSGLTGAEKATGQLSATLDRGTRSVNAHGQALESMGRTASIASAAIGAAFGMVIGASIKLAMTAVESENLFDVSMGESAKAAREWSEMLRNELGLNAYEVRKNIGTYNVMFGSMGIGKQAAFEMAKGITQLSYDMASFYNLDTKSAFEKLRAGVTGEIEPLRQLGIMVNETTVKDYALAQGLIKVGQEMSEAQKTVARYGLILQQTSVAQGDLARTMQSPANQLRIFQAQLTETGIQAGMVFLPLVANAFGWLNKVGIPAARAAIKEFGDSWKAAGAEGQRNILIIGGLLMGAGPLMLALSFAFKAVVALGTAFQTLKMKALIELYAISLAADKIGDSFEALSNALAGKGFTIAQPRNSMGALLQTIENAASKLIGPGGLVNSIDDALGKMGVKGIPGLQALKDAFALVTDTANAFTKATDENTGAAYNLNTEWQKWVQTPDIAALFRQASAGAESLGKSAKGAAVSVADLTSAISALVAANPAVVAAGEAVAAWKQRIEDVNLAIIANRDQIKAAEADYQGMQDRLSGLRDELGKLKEKLTDLASPRLTGMGEMDDKIAAAAKQLQRLQYAAATGLPMDQVMKLFPILTEGMEGFIGSLPAAIRDNADALQKFLEGLKATKDLKYSEQLDLIKKAAEGTKKEMDFSEVMKSIIETKAKITDVTGAIQAQENAMKAQKAVIDDLKKISDDLNATLATYQKELKLAEDYQRDLEKALKDAYDWFLNDKDAVEKMGGSAVAIAGDISTAYAAILGVVDASVTTATGNVSAAIAGIQKQIEDLKAALAGLGVPADLGIKSIGTMGIHPVPGRPFKPLPIDTNMGLDRGMTLASNLKWFVPGLMGGAFDVKIKDALEQYKKDLDKFNTTGDLAKQAEAQARLIAAMDAVRAEYNRTADEMTWYNNLLYDRALAERKQKEEWERTAWLRSTPYLTELARAQVIAWTRAQQKNPGQWSWSEAMKNAGLSFALGGIVPGPVGAPVLAQVHGGEVITPAGGAGNVYNLNFGRDSVRSEDDLRAISREVSRIMGGGITLRN